MRCNGTDLCDAPNHFVATDFTYPDTGDVRQTVVCRSCKAQWTTTITNAEAVRQGEDAQDYDAHACQFVAEEGSL